MVINPQVNNFNPDEFIDKGYVISPNFLIEHVTEGAMHNAIGRVIPMFTHPLNLDVINNQSSLIGIVQNLITNVASTLDPIFSELGSGTIVRQAFKLNPETIFNNNEEGHVEGTSIDIAFNGEDHNMYHVASDIQRIANRATSMTLVYDTMSWIHINVTNRNRANLPDHWLSAEELPEITTVDNTTQEFRTGIVPFRGLL